jgi:hypothetical protein
VAEEFLAPEALGDPGGRIAIRLERPRSRARFGRPQALEREAPHTDPPERLGQPPPPDPPDAAHRLGVCGSGAV